MIILVGPSASGKTEVGKALTSRHGFKKFVTTTTRNPRIGEINGLDYNFVTVDTFLKKIENNEFIEYTFYNGNYYGTEKRMIDDNTVLIVDYNGLISFKKSSFPNIHSYYLICEEAKRIKRMENRGDTKEMIQQRLNHDRFKFDSTVLEYVDEQVVEKDMSIEEVAEYIYKDYKNKLENKK